MSGVLPTCNGGCGFPLLPPGSGRKSGFRSEMLVGERPSGLCRKCYDNPRMLNKRESEYAVSLAWDIWFKQAKRAAA